MRRPPHHMSCHPTTDPLLKSCWRLLVVLMAIRKGSDILSKKVSPSNWTNFSARKNSLAVLSIPHLKSNLRAAAYEAVMEMIKNSPEDCYPTVLKTTEEIMKCIQGTFTMQISQSERSQFNDLQSLLCATLQVGFISN